MAERELIAEGEDAPIPELPETFSMSLEMLRRYLGVWQIWVATGKRHLLSDLMAEPDEAWSVVLEMENTFQVIKKQKKEQQNG